ncbi:MAG: winged helix-turn-helix transcriptional regulator [Gemmatimonadales bacterium]|nr:MAG: winged helix-turn-helix transcriptional regulator [Gemmatimonadales bacterium]
MKQPETERFSSPEELAQHLLVLDLLAREGNISQRALGIRVGLAPTRVNRLIRELVGEGRVEVEDSARPYSYRLTARGQVYRRRLSLEHDQSVVQSFRAIQAYIARRLQELRAEGPRRRVPFGAGRIMEVTLPLARGLDLEVVGIVDDDDARQGQRRGGLVGPALREKSGRCAATRSSLPPSGTRSTS